MQNRGLSPVVLVKNTGDEHENRGLFRVNFIKPQNMNWLDIPDGKSLAVNHVAFWGKLRADLRDGTFWADRITELRNQPVERLKLAIDNLPLPAAFREAAIATKAVIRERIKKNEDFADELALLYWLAAIESFGIPYSEYLQQPGFNVLQSIPVDVIKSLPFSYSQLGYKHLGLLNKTDIKRFVARWGEPLEHTTLNKLHAETWRKFEIEERLRQERQRQALWSR